MNNRVHGMPGLTDTICLIWKKAGTGRKNFVKTYRVWKTQQVVLLFVCTLLSCQHNYAPKPQAYFRIDFPEREYRMYDSICPFAFEYPVYGKLVNDARPHSEPCWFDLKFPEYRGTIHLTYREMDNDFDRFIEDNWKILFTGIASKADAIEYEDFYDREGQVYATIYDIKGNAASHVQFYVTDSVKNFLRGSLYFNVRPNHDSLAPVVAFFREDIVHLIESIRWKEKQTKK